MSNEQCKEIVAEAAAALVQSDMRLGLGSGTTAELWVRAVGRRLRAGTLRGLLAVASSRSIAQLARDEGIDVLPSEALPELDLGVDGADEIGPAPRYPLTKGGGGALEGEFPLAVRSRRWVVIADESKCVERLGTRMPLPVAVDPAEAPALTAWLRQAVGCAPTLRMRAGSSAVFVTDAGSQVLDCRFPDGIHDPEALAQKLDAARGIRRHGLFLGLASQVLIGRADGVEVRVPSDQ